MRPQAATFCLRLYERGILSADFFIQWMESEDASLLYIYDEAAKKEMKELLTDFVDSLQYEYFDDE